MPEGYVSAKRGNSGDGGEEGHPDEGATRQLSGDELDALLAHDCAFADDFWPMTVGDGSAL